MFDMQKIGKRIVTLRKEKNMTQMELADKLGISFQAVSNWERGNSMPDISKLPELAEIFGVTLDELLGEKSPLIEAAVEDRLEECIEKLEVEKEDVEKVLPLLKPDQIQNMAGHVDAKMLNAFLPFMDEEVVAEWAREAKRKGEIIGMYLPFMDEDDVADMAKEALYAKQDVAMYIPYMDEDDVKELLLEAMMRKR